MAQGDHERAHSLAWRTVQQGPRNDRSLMYLLARTQAVSGRPDDALVMVRRIAELGTIVDVSTDEFARMRELPAWPAVEAVIAGVANPTTPAMVPSPPAAEAPRVSASPGTEPGAPRRGPLEAPEAPTPAPKAPLAPVAPERVLVPVAVEKAGHFTSREFAPGGLACDAVSKRFVFGDRPGKKVLVLAEGSDHSIDLTRADVAGFLDVLALDIDTTNGNLWVASAGADGSGASLHRLQLISGRPIARYVMPGESAGIQPVDVAVTAGRGVLVLDAAQRRVLILRPRASALEVLVNLGDTQPVSLTVGSQDRVFVAHRDGVLSIDLRTRKVVPITGPKGTPLGGIERLRRDGAGLVGVQGQADGSRRLVRLTLNATRGAVTRLRVFDAPLPAGDAPIYAAVCGNTLGFLVGEAVGREGQGPMAWTIRRITLSR